jgi:hypothetical protein
VEYSRGRELGDHSSWEHVEVLEPLENACKRARPSAKAGPVMGVLMPMRWFTAELIMPVFEAIVTALQNRSAGIESALRLYECTTWRLPVGERQNLLGHQSIY